MPAQTKYLSSKPQRALKIVTALLGGYLVSASFHLMIGVISVAREGIVVLSGISFFLVWAGLMVVAFLARSGGKIGAFYLLLTLIFGGITWMFK